MGAVAQEVATLRPTRDLVDALEERLGGVVAEDEEAHSEEEREAVLRREGEGEAQDAHAGGGGGEGTLGARVRVCEKESRMGGFEAIVSGSGRVALVPEDVALSQACPLWVGGWVGG
jgi:hypothetical protein